MHKYKSRLLFLHLLVIVSLVAWSATTLTPVKGAIYPIFVEVDSFPTSTGTWFLDLDDQGNIYLTVAGNDQISIYHPNGTLLDTISVPDPIGIEVIGTQIYVTSGSINNLSVWENGELINSISVVNPYDLAVTPNGTVYVTSGNQVHIYNPNLLPVATLDGLHTPRGVDIAPDGRIFVLDGNKNITVFGSDLSLLGFIGQAGTGPGEFQDPNQLDIDVDGYIYVADYSLDRVQVFSPDLQYVGAITGINSVVGVQADGNGRVYVNNYDTGGIRVFETLDLGDHDGPHISSIIHDPVNPVAGQPIKVTTEITDLSGVHNATLTYTSQFASGTLLLTRDNGSYTATLPAFLSGSVIVLTLWAEDASLAHHTTTLTYTLNVGSLPVIPGIDTNYLAIGGLGLGAIALIITLRRRPASTRKKSRR